MVIDFNTTFSEIVKLTPTEPKNVLGMMNHLMQEVGELAEAVAVAEGISNKQLNEPLSGEVADVMNCALAVFVRLNPTKTTNQLLTEILEQFALKTNKWFANTQLAKPKHTFVDDIERRVYQEISTQLGVTLEDVKPSSNLVSDLGADSLDQIELVMAIEDEFNIDVPDEDAEKIAYVHEAYDYVRSKLQKSTLASKVPQLSAQAELAQSVKPQSGKVYAQIRRHPAGVNQPTGKRRVYRMSLDSTGKTLLVGIGENGSEGWRFNMDAADPSFITFRIDKETGPVVTMKEAFEYWQRHNQ